MKAKKVWEVGDSVWWATHAGRHEGKIVSISEGCCDEACSGRLCVVKLTEWPNKRFMAEAGLLEHPGMDETEMCDTAFGE